MRKSMCTLGVGDGSGNLSVHGDYDSIKTVQKKLLELEELRVENAKLRVGKDYIKDQADAWLEVVNKFESLGINPFFTGNTGLEDVLNTIQWLYNRAEANDAIEKISPKQYWVDTVNHQLKIKKKHLAKIYDGLSTGMIDIPEAGSDEYDKDAEI